VNIDEAILLAVLGAGAVELAGPKGYVHGWRYVGGPGLPSVPPGGRHGVDLRGNSLRRRGFGEKSVGVARSSEGSRGALAHKAMPASAGSPEHAKELRALAAEADRRQVENYNLLKTHGGGASFHDMQRAGGTSPDKVPESETARTLRRAATMIERGQPSLARVHAGTLKADSATERRMRPEYSDRLSAAADKLRKLPMNEGLARNPADNAESLRRTAQAQAYASGESRRRLIAQQAANRRRNARLSWEDTWTAIELATLG
jgi:hypothetical protein